MSADGGAPAEVNFRVGVPDDLPAVAEVFLAARAAAVPRMPPIVHTPAEVRAWFGGFDLVTGGRDLWVAEAAGWLVGFAEVKDDWLDDLYVHPDQQGLGLGGTLLDLAKAARPQGFCLWVFETNAPARAFYARRGLVELERTDGSGNEERSPDVKMAWPGREPLTFLRGLIDDVDAHLAELMSRRLALTRAVQDHKHDRSRDPARERRIAEAMAELAPEIGADRLGRIMHVVIGELLDASQQSGQQLEA